MNVGVYGIGTYLPDEVRTNEWWPEAVRADWWRRPDGRLDRGADTIAETDSEGARIVLEMMAKYRHDPFKGARERRVMPEGMLTSQMEVAAAERAIAAAGVDRSAIDLVLDSTTLPDYWMVPNACAVHAKLGLSSRCFTLQTEGVCNAFLLQLSLAEKMIKSGQAHLALLVQSSGTSRLVRPQDPHSAWFGDGATAVVVGPVEEGYGILAERHLTWGHLAEGIVCGIPGKRWWDEGRPFAYNVRPELARELVIKMLPESRLLIHECLAQVGHRPEDVDFLACHQGFAWLREVVQAHAGLSQARSVDTFPWAGSVLGANLPLVLSVGCAEGLLGEGQLVAAFSGAAGAVNSGMVLRWGGRRL